MTWILLLLLAVLVQSSEVQKFKRAGENAFANGDFKEALAQFSQLIALEPNNERNYYQRFRVHLSMRAYVKAIQDLNHCLDLNPTYTKSLSQRAKLHLMLGHCDKSIQDYQTLQDNPSGLQKAQKCQELLNQAEQAQSSAQYELAYETLSTVIEEYTTSSAFLLLDLAQLSVSKGDIFGAIADSGRALKLDGSNVAALQFRGNLFYSLGDLDSFQTAIQHFRSALHSDPEHRAIKKQFRQSKNIVKFTQAGSSHLKSQRYQEAYDAFERALQVDPVHEAVTRDLILFQCECMVAMRSVSVALSLCERAVSLNTDSAQAHAQYGEALMLNEQFDEAVRVYNKAVELDESNREIKTGAQKASAALKQSKMKNYYKILNVARQATKKEIKKAYHKKALEWHPDKHADSDEASQEKANAMFKDVAQAYEILTDDDLRSRYDRGEDVTGNNDEQQQNPFRHFQQGGRTFHFNFG